MATGVVAAVDKFLPPFQRMQYDDDLSPLPLCVESEQA